jgi:hypothetical protein
VIALPSRTFFNSPPQKLIVLVLLVVAVAGGYKMTSHALSARVGAVFSSQDRTVRGV